MSRFIHLKEIAHKMASFPQPALSLLGFYFHGIPLHLRMVSEDSSVVSIEHLTLTNLFHLDEATTQIIRLRLFCFPERPEGSEKMSQYRLLSSLAVRLYDDRRALHIAYLRLKGILNNAGPMAHAANTARQELMSTCLTAMSTLYHAAQDLPFGTSLPYTPSKNNHQITGYQTA